MFWPLLIMWEFMRWGFFLWMIWLLPWMNHVSLICFFWFNLLLLLIIDHGVGGKHTFSLGFGISWVGIFVFICGHMREAKFTPWVIVGFGLPVFILLLLYAEYSLKINFDFGRGGLDGTTLSCVSLWHVCSWVWWVRRS